MSSSHSSTDVVRDLALQVFGTDQAVDFWMKNPNAEFHGQSPNDLIACGHTDQVKDYLESLFAGDFG